MRPREISVVGDVAYVPLTQGQIAIIDAADVPLVEGRNWYAAKSRNTFYAQRAEGGTVILMHRVLMDVPADMEVDHENGDGLDNRRTQNLRVATKAQNQINAPARHNSTGYTGVHYVKAKGRWVATIRDNGKRRYLGMYSSPELAGAAFERAAASVSADFRRAI